MSLVLINFNVDKIRVFKLFSLDFLLIFLDIKHANL